MKGVCFDFATVAGLEDSAISTLGLPIDVFCLVCTLLEVRDIGRVAQVCKTWRKASLRDSVWRHFGAFLQIDCGRSPRSDVLRYCYEPFAHNSVFLPLSTAKVQFKLGEDVRVVAMSPIFVSNNAAPQGKSSLVIRFVQGHFVEMYDATIEDSYRKLVDVDGCQVHFEILDTSGQEEFSGLRGEWMRGGQAFLICHTFDSPGVIGAVDQLREQIIQAKGKDKAAIVLVRTMSDGKEVVESFKIRQWCRLHSIPFISTSAKSDVNIQESFLVVARMLEKNY
jgi:small GTP-binding protein